MFDNIDSEHILSPIINLPNQGEIEGVVCDNIASFKGVPYAMPPVGEYRWRPPQPVIPWCNLKKTVNFAPNCSQKLNSWDNDISLQIQSEDCLYLNIWTPQLNFRNQNNKTIYPVMVWIHGGGFVSGGSSQNIYNGDVLAKQNVVVVSFNYRLGRLGFFSHPSLKNECLSANFGLMDQIAALKWIKDNISIFGGDANNITIFGESAGGAAIFSLMTIKEVQGLFHKAIIQSGTGHFRIFPSTTKKQAEIIDTKFAHKHHIYTSDISALQQLKELSVKHIIGNLNVQNLQSELFSGLTIDQILIHNTLADLYKKGEFYPVPLMIGDNDGDGVFLSQMSLDQMLKHINTSEDVINHIYNPTGKNSKTKTLYQLAADIQFLEPTKWVISQIAKKNITIYRYRFSYVAETARAYTSFGAPHASEIPYIFNKLSYIYKTISIEDQTVADTMMLAWTAFAKNGSPNTSELPFVYPTFIEPEKLLNFTKKGSSFEEDPLKNRLEFIQECLK